MRMIDQKPDWMCLREGCTNRVGTKYLDVCVYCAHAAGLGVGAGGLLDIDAVLEIDENGH